MLPPTKVMPVKGVFFQASGAGVLEKRGIRPEPIGHDAIQVGDDAASQHFWDEFLGPVTAAAEATTISIKGTIGRVFKGRDVDEKVDKWGCGAHSSKTLRQVDGGPFMAPVNGHDFLGAAPQRIERPLGDFGEVPEDGDDEDDHEIPAEEEASESQEDETEEGEQEDDGGKAYLNEDLWAKLLLQPTKEGRPSLGSPGFRSLAGDSGLRSFAGDSPVSQISTCSMKTGDSDLEACSGPRPLELVGLEPGSWLGHVLDARRKGLLHSPPASWKGEFSPSSLLLAPVEASPRAATTPPPPPQASAEEGQKGRVQSCFNSQQKQKFFGGDQQDLRFKEVPSFPLRRLPVGVLRSEQDSSRRSSTPPPASLATQPKHQEERNKEKQMVPSMQPPHIERTHAANGLQDHIDRFERMHAAGTTRGRRRGGSWDPAIGAGHASRQPRRQKHQETSPVLRIPAWRSAIKKTEPSALLLRRYTALGLAAGARGATTATTTGENTEKATSSAKSLVVSEKILNVLIPVPLDPEPVFYLGSFPKNG